MSDPHDLKPWQAKTLLFILTTICKRQRPPTYEEIGKRFHITPKNGAAYRVNALVRKGWLAANRSIGSKGKRSATLQVLGCRYKVAGDRLEVILDGTDQGWRLASLIMGEIALTNETTKDTDQ